MMTVYLVSDKIAKPIVLLYEENQYGQMVFTACQSLPTLTTEQHLYLMKVLAERQVYPDDGKFGVFGVTLDVANAHQLTKKKKGSNKKQKIGRFCGLYKQVTGLQYEVKPWDAKLVEQTEFDSELIRIFLENDFWFNRDGNKTIQCYCKNINSLKLYQSGAQNNKEFPDDYDPALEKILSGKKLNEYWAHLRAQGWSPRKAPGRGTTGWENTDGRYISKY